MQLKNVNYLKLKSFFCLLCPKRTFFHGFLKMWKEMFWSGLSCKSLFLTQQFKRSPLETFTALEYSEITERKCYMYFVVGLCVLKAGARFCSFTFKMVRQRVTFCFKTCLMRIPTAQGQLAICWLHSCQSDVKCGPDPLSDLTFDAGLGALSSLLRVRNR